jgi:transposase
MRKGALWLKTTLVQCAWAAARKKASYLQAQFHRLRARRGAKKAIGALAASILTIIYRMLTDGALYHDLGPDHFDKRGEGKQVYQLINRVPDPQDMKRVGVLGKLPSRCRRRGRCHLGASEPVS